MSTSVNIHHLVDQMVMATKLACMPADSVVIESGVDSLHRGVRVGIMSALAYLGENGIITFTPEEELPFALPMGVSVEMKDMILRDCQDS